MKRQEIAPIGGLKGPSGLAGTGHGSRPVFFALALALTACASATAPGGSPSNPEPADLVLLAGRVHTETGTVSALAIREGRVVAVGSDSELARHLGPTSQRIDLQGASVLPGFVDRSVDLLALGMRRAALDLVGSPSPESVAAAVRGWLQTSPQPAGAWLYGRGWDVRDFRTRRYPDRSVLDPAAPNLPVVLESIDGQAVWVNSAALAEAGIDRHTEDPTGGRILRDRRGEPTGVLLGSATQLVRERMPPPRGEDLARVLLLAQRECAASGLVAVHMPGASAATLEALRRLDRSEDLRLRVQASHDGSALALSELLEEGTHQGRRIRIDGVRFRLDSPLESGGAARFRSNSASSPWVADLDYVRARAQTAVSRGFHLEFEVHGDQAVAEALDILEAGPGAPGGWLLGPRLIRKRDLERVRRAGVRVAAVPSRTVRQHGQIDGWVGSRALPQVDAYRSWLTSGATLAFASEAPTQDPAASFTLLAATTRTDLLGEPEGGFVPDERLSMEDAVRVYSGRGLQGIRLGEPADLTVLNQDPFDATDLELASARVRLTLVEGEVVYALPGALSPAVTETSTSSP